MPEPEYIKKSGLDEALESDLSTGLDEEYFDYYAGSANKRIKLVEIFKKALGIVSGGVRPIGTNVDGAFVTTNASQDVSNKDLIDCKINGGDVLTVTSTELNHIAGIDAKVSDTLTALDSAVGVNATDIAKLEEQIMAVESESSVNKKFTATYNLSNASQSFDTTDIDADNAINHLNIIAKMYQNESGILKEVATTGLEIHTKTESVGSKSVTMLHRIIFPSVTGQFTFVIYYSNL